MSRKRRTNRELNANIEATDCADASKGDSSPIIEVEKLTQNEFPENDRKELQNSVQVSPKSTKELEREKITPFESAPQTDGNVKTIESPEFISESEGSSKKISNLSSTYLQVFDSVSSFVKAFRYEIVIALVGMIIAYGQYVQSVTSIRINVTDTWRAGYNDEVRNRSTKFIEFYKNWKSECKVKKDKDCFKRLNRTLQVMTSLRTIYHGEIKPYLGENVDGIKIEGDVDISSIVGNLKEFDDKEIRRDYAIEADENIKDLIYDDLLLQGLIDNKPTPKVPLPNSTNEETVEGKEVNDKSLNDVASKETQDRGPLYDKKVTRAKIIEIVLKYRNAILECLNTSEAVRSVILAKPYLSRDIVKDTLKTRYEEVVDEQAAKLKDFIDEYRNSKWCKYEQFQKGQSEKIRCRETVAWHVLTDGKEDASEIWFLIYGLGIFLLIFVVLFGLKKIAINLHGSKENQVS